MSKVQQVLERAVSKSILCLSTDDITLAISVSGLKIEGIKHSANLWFYTVQGLFAAAFEHLDINAQRDCLLKLKVAAFSLTQDLCE